MRAARAFGRWLSDWHNGATVVVSVIVALVAYLVIDSRITEHQALDAAKQALSTRDDTATNARRRIDLLNERIEELTTAQYATSVEVGAARVEIAALQEQVRQLGGEPVIVYPPPSSTSTTAPRSTTTTSSPPSTTTTTQPPDDCRVVVLGRCIGGRP